MRKLRIALAACVGAAILIPASLHAQDATQVESQQQDGEIVVEGQVRPDHENPQVRIHKRPNHLASFGVWPPPKFDGKGDTKYVVDWKLVGMVREQASYSTAERYRYAAHMANCVLASRGNKAAEYIDIDDKPQFKKLERAYRGRHMQCANSAERASPMMFVNGVMAEMLVLANVDVPPLRAEDLPAEQVNSFLGGPRVLIDLPALGRCLAVYSPGYGYDLFYTLPGSDEEEEALDRMYRNSPECGVTERPEKVDTVQQRLAIALGLFRWYGISGEEWLPQAS